MEKNSGQIENKAPDITGLMITAILNTKIDEVEKKIPDVSKSVKTHRGTIFYYCWLY